MNSRRHRFRSAGVPAASSRSRSDANSRPLKRRPGRALPAEGLASTFKTVITQKGLIPSEPRVNGAMPALAPQ